MANPFERRPQTDREERVNVITHALATGLAAIGFILMLSYAITQGDSTKIVSAAVFGAAMVLLYLTSTLYHAVTHQDTKQLMRKIDHSAIYLLIAGTYTPFTLIAIKGPLGWALFGIVWGLAISGILFKVFVIHRFEFVTVLIYIAMGWMGVVAFKPALEALNVDGMTWLVAGGLSYTVGVIFYLWRAMPYHHGVWHLFTMAGTACHFAAVHFYVLTQ